ncbi:MAG: aspartate aminotransferase family protein [Anaerolineaceae bacterium]|nr:aspartate aminotransferase family protein [Anaerolineaceae bacterium]
METMQLEKNDTSGVYAKREISLVRGQGACLFDDQGKRYIDCVGGQGTANIGHCQPPVVQAITDQLNQLMICPEIFYHPNRGLFYDALLSALGPAYNRVFLCNSGTEAVEAALKFSRFLTGRTKILAAMRCFHGRTMGALSATWNKHYRQPFMPLVPDYDHFPYDNIDKMTAKIDDQTAAVILEVVQGEGGIYPGSTAFFQAARELCSKHGALLIIDEVQSGFGRTGKLFAFMHHDIQPDLITMGKSIAAGIPMGAVVLNQDVPDLRPGIHGSTFGGNPVATAAAIASLKFIQENHLVENAAEMGAYFVDQLQAIDSPLIREVRGKGLMIGMELKQKVAPILAKLAEEGVLALPAGMNVLRFLPPLVINKEQIDQVIAATRKALAE